MSELLKPIDAAQLAGVSYPTLKQWIYKGKIRTTKTAGGHHRISRSEIERVTGMKSKKQKRGKPVGLDAISGRNKLFGTITDLRYEGLLVQVTINVSGQRRPTFARSTQSSCCTRSRNALKFTVMKPAFKPSATAAST